MDLNACVWEMPGIGAMKGAAGHCPAVMAARRIHTHPPANFQEVAQFAARHKAGTLALCCRILCSHQPREGKDLAPAALPRMRPWTMRAAVLLLSLGLLALANGQPSGTNIGLPPSATATGLAPQVTNQWGDGEVGWGSWVGGEWVGG